MTWARLFSKIGRLIAGSSNGRTTDSGSVYLRSNRSPAAKNGYPKVTVIPI